VSKDQRAYRWNGQGWTIVPGMYFEREWQSILNWILTIFQCIYTGSIKDVAVQNASGVWAVSTVGGENYILCYDLYLIKYLFLLNKKVFINGTVIIGVNCQVVTNSTASLSHNTGTIQSLMMSMMMSSIAKRLFTCQQCLVVWRAWQRVPCPAASTTCLERHQMRIYIGQVIIISALCCTSFIIHFLVSNGSFTPDKAVDGSLESFYWSQRAARGGDTFTVSLLTPIVCSFYFFWKKTFFEINFVFQGS